MNRRIWVPVLVGALGYFVDIFDLALFGIVRIASLKDMGVPEEELMSVGVNLLNSQMAGLLVGGLVWGVLGDKKGRVRVLFGSIILYSVANILNGFVTTVEAYALFRFIAGVGLAGELGAAITLVSESLPKEKRGIGTSLVAGVGLSGAIFAGIASELFHWRTTYFLGGGMGLLLLFLRMGILESSMFLKAEASTVRRGDVLMLLHPKERFLRYLFCIGIGVPIWFCAGILMTFAPELGKELGTTGPLSAGKAIMYSYIGIAIADVLSGLLSQWLKSRKKVVAMGIVTEFLFAGIILYSKGITPGQFYFLAFWIGASTGYWAIFMTLAAEQFGTNLRSTATTSIPNFVRGSVIPMTLGFRALSQHYSLVTSATIVGATTALIGAFSLLGLKETFGKDLDYLE